MGTTNCNICSKPTPDHQINHAFGQKLCNDCFKHIESLKGTTHPGADERKMVQVPTEFGVYGVWAFKITNHNAYVKNQVKGMLIPCAGMEHMETISGNYKDMNAFIKSSYSNRTWLLRMLNEGADVITIGRGSKWQIYELYSQTVMDIATEIVEELDKHTKADDC